jgi:hypothetical protein
MLVHLRKLLVADNGIGKSDGVFAQPETGLGTGIVKALAKQLDSQVVTLSGPKGTTVSVTHATLRGSRRTIGSCQLIAKLPAPGARNLVGSRIGAFAKCRRAMNLSAYRV